MVVDLSTAPRSQSLARSLTTISKQLWWQVKLPWMPWPWIPNWVSAIENSSSSCGKSWMRPGQKHLQQPELKPSKAQLKTRRPRRVCQSEVLLSRHSWGMCRPKSGRSRMKRLWRSFSTSRTKLATSWLPTSSSLSSNRQRMSCARTLTKQLLAKSEVVVISGWESFWILLSGVKLWRTHTFVFARWTSSTWRPSWRQWSSPGTSSSWPCTIATSLSTLIRSCLAIWTKC